MFSITNVEVYDLENAIKASKYPMATDVDRCTQKITKTVTRLANADTGSGHDNFLKGILVSFDMRFSVKMSVELERYHFINFVSSQSTMHCIAKFELSKQCNEYVDDRIIKVCQGYIDEYNALVDKSTDTAKELYLKILYNIPVGFELTARLTTNYQQLKTIYFQRRNHRLPEWRTFCKWVEQLPCSEFIIGEVVNE